MSADDKEPPAPPVRRKRRRRLIPLGAQCRQCGSIGRSRVEETYRRFKCLNDSCQAFVETGIRHRWHVKIPAQAIYNPLFKTNAVAKPDVIDKQ